MLTLLLVPVTAVVVASFTNSAQAAGAVSPAIDKASGFPVWYQDAADNRVVACLDANDPNCVLPPTGYDPAAPLSVPDNFPDEFFYAVATSDVVSTLGCNGTVPGKALVTLALEGAFLNGPPASGEQMVFGRIRVKVTSGLCPNTTYLFRHPFGTDQFTTNGAGAVPANAGTQDVGCVPAIGAPCDFAKATLSRVMGSAADGLLRWDPAVAPAAPAGYLGDGATLHPIVGGTNGNSFAILDTNGNPLVDAANGNAPLATDNFTVAGKLAGSLTAAPSPADFGGQDLGTTSAVKTVTVTNLDKTPVTPQAAVVAGGDAGDFAVAPGTDTCANAVLNRDQSCTIGVTFAPSAPGRRSSSLVVASTGGVRSPLSVTLTGSGVAVGAAPAVGLAPAALDTGSARIRTESAPATLRITNTGTAPLGVRDIQLANVGISGAEQFRISSDTCATGQFVDPGNSCTVSVVMAPTVRGVHTAQLQIYSNASSSPDLVPITGTGTGGVAAVSPQLDPTNGFPTWYRDENGIKVQQCLDTNDPNCIVLPDEFFDPARPVSFPTNFPSEFFYQVATSDNIITPGCNGGATGRALFRSALEGAFVNAGPVPGEQMVFGRIRIVVRGGLCPNTTYNFVHPYGSVKLTTNGNGGIAPNAGTDDVGCAPIAPDTCDFSLALSSRVLGSLLRWDPAVAPAAPAGYLGDAVTLHPVTGAPYSVDGTPANYFEIQQADGTSVGRTAQFTVAGRLLGPLEASPGALALDVTPVGSTSASGTVTFTNTGIAPLDVTSLTIGGLDPADFQIASTTCAGLTLQVGGTCTAEVNFTPTATGDRAATLTVHHSGLNDPLEVSLSGVGAAQGATAAISFAPRAVTFAPLHVGSSSPIQTVNVSNAGGQAPLDVNSVGLSGAAQANFAIVDQNCVGTPVAPGASCQVRVAFTPQVAGNLTATLVVTDNAPGTRHTLGLSGTGSTAAPAVAATTDSRNGFPQWYQDSTGTRLEACLDPADVNCVLLPDATFDPANPVSFPTNFPGEFFYALADSNLINTPGCGGTTPGTAMLRLALEGSFANGTPVPDEQTTFARLRIVVTSGLCPNTPYRFTTPYGVVPFTTNAAGGLPRNQGTVDIGCGAAGCNFAAALADPDPATGLTDTVAHSFLRWDPAVATPPAGYLGDAKSYKKVVGGTYVPAGAGEPVNYASIVDTAGNEIARTDTFLVSGRIAGPLQSDTYSVDFGRLPAGQLSQVRTVTLTNVLAGTTVQSVTATGVNAADFAIDNASTCVAAANLALDATCQVKVTFAPTTTGTKTATLRVVPASGSPVLIALRGIADPPAAPAATVTPGTLAYGTVTAPNSATLSTTVSNTGTANLVVGQPALGGTAAADYAITANTCTTPVAPGARCTISVRFTPTAIGSRTASLTIPHNATGGQTVVSLTATGAGSTFVMTPNPVNFGTQNLGSVKTQTVTVKNSGTLAFTLGAGSITGTDAAAFTVSGAGCSGTVLQPGKTCNLTVTFRPTQARSYTATLVLAGDASSLPPTASTRLTGSAK